MAAVEKKKKQNANVMRAGMACGESKFQNFLKQSFTRQWKESAARPEMLKHNDEASYKSDVASETLRKVLGIESRSILAKDRGALERFDRLMAEYEMWKRGE
jgi:hypothetical protein